MTNFVLIYTGGTIPETEAEQQEVMAAWGAWYQKMGDKVVDGGNPFSNSKHVTANGVHEGPGHDAGIGGYTIISADSLDEAAALVENHPQTKYGGAVSVYETFQM